MIKIIKNNVKKEKVIIRVKIWRIMEKYDNLIKVKSQWYVNRLKYIKKEDKNNKEIRWNNVNTKIKIE